MRAAFDVVLRRKAVVAEALLAQRDAMLGGQYPHLRTQFDRLTAVRRQIARQTLAGLAPGRTVTQHQQELAALRTEQERLERELAREIPEINVEQRLRVADRRRRRPGPARGRRSGRVRPLRRVRLQGRAGTGERRWLPARYLAFVLRAGEPDAVEMIDLGPTEDIDPLITDFRHSITGDPNDGGATSNPSTTAVGHTRGQRFGPAGKGVRPLPEFWTAETVSCWPPTVT